MKARHRKKALNMNHNRLVSLFTVCIASLGLGSTRCNAQEYDATIAYIETVSELGKQAHQLGTFAWDYHKPESTSRCTDCHVGTESETEDGQSWVFRYVNAITDRGVLLGDFRVGNLQDPILRGHLQLEEKPALVVWNAPEGSTQLKSGDVLLSLNGKPIEDAVGFKKAVGETDTEEIKIACIRAGKHIDLKVSRESLLDKPEPQLFKIGVQVEQPSAALRSQLQLYANEGILVIDVVADSPAQKSGLKKHDILLRADSVRLTAFEDLDATVQASEGAPMKLVVLRSGKEEAILVKPVAQDKPEFKPVCPGMTADSYIRVLNQDS